MFQSGDKLLFGDIQTTLEIEAVSRKAFLALENYFMDLTPDHGAARRAARSVNSAILHYRATNTAFQVRRRNGRVLFKEVRATNDSASAIRRLANVKTEWAWLRAWFEMPYAAHRAVVQADARDEICWRPDPDFGAVPIRDSVKPLIEPAISIAREYAARHTTANPARTSAIIAILDAYMLIHGSAPSIPLACHFIANVTLRYKAYLPPSLHEKFNSILRSRDTLPKIISEWRRDRAS